MLQQFVKIGSILLLASACLCSMERPKLKELAIKKVAELATHNPRYYIKAFYTLPHELSTPIIEHLVLTNKGKSALPIILLGYKYCQQRSDNRHHLIHLTCSNNNQIQLTSNQSRELIQASAAISNLIQDLKEHVEEIPLPLLTQEQITNLLPYISIINALNTSNSTLPILQQEIPEVTVLPSYYFKYTALQHLKEHLTSQTIPMLCDLIITASYLDIKNSRQTINLTELAIQALGEKLLQALQYQEGYDAITMLPDTMQCMLVHYLINNSAVRHVLCSNSTHVIASTAQTLIGHTSYVQSVSWSPDGKHIVSGSLDNTVRIWNAQSGTCIHTLTGHTSGIHSVSWSHDSSMIASGSDDKTIKIWSATTDNSIHTLTGHTGKVYSVSWLPDDKHIASCSSDNTIKIWDASTGICIRTLVGHTSYDYSVSWSPDNRYIASNSWLNTIKVWDITTGTCIHTLKDNTHWIYSVSWSPDGKHIASGSKDNTIKVWDTAMGTCIHTLTGHTDTIYSVSWSPDGSMLVSGSNDDTIKIWDIINTRLTDYLCNTLSWEQALLFTRLVSKQDIDFAQDKQVRHCYTSLPEDIKQLVQPLLSESIRSALDIAIH